MGRILTAIALLVLATIVVGCIASSPPVCAGTCVTLASSQSLPASIVVDATSVYWTNSGTAPSYGNGAVVKVPLGGGIAVNTTSVYWTTTSTVMKLTPK